MLRKFLEGSIRRQIGLLSVGLMVLVILLSGLTEPFSIDDIEGVSEERLMAIKLEAIHGYAQAAGPQGQREAVIEAVRRSGIQVDLVPSAILSATDPPPDTRDFRRKVQQKLPPHIASMTATMMDDGTATDVLAVELDGGQSLAFRLTEPPIGRWFSDTQIDIMWKATIVFAPVMLLFFYVGNMIASPLLRFARHAEQMDPDDASIKPFSESGAQEIQALARSLNGMHQRVHQLIDQRTRMLRAISHDLRTPLTRLRLRAEKSSQPELRDAMVADIQSLTAMIQEILEYLSKDAMTEPAINADLPSLIETVCSAFEDMGHSVSYHGPAALSYVCKPRALARAISNLVDNGTKFAKHVDVSLDASAPGFVIIRVADDGPGIPPEMRRSVLEPFFKADASRGGPAGFGLGLSIVQEIVAKHGGNTTLGQSSLGGLEIEVRLPLGPVFHSKS